MLQAYKGFDRIVWERRGFLRPYEMRRVEVYITIFRELLYVCNTPRKQYTRTPDPRLIGVQGYTGRCVQGVHSTPKCAVRALHRCFVDGVAVEERPEEVTYSVPVPVGVGSTGEPYGV